SLLAVAALATSIDNKANAQAAAGDLPGAATTSQRWFEMMDKFLRTKGEEGEAMLVPMLEVHGKRLEAAGRTAEAQSLKDRAQQIRLQHPELVARFEDSIAK